MAEALAARGYHVIAVARTVGGLEELDDRIKAAGGAATLVPLDLTNEDGLRQVCRSIHDRWGHVDVLVHAAIHAPPLCPLPHMDEKDMDKSIAINMRATARLIANVAPLLKAAQDPLAVFFDDPAKAKKFHTTYGFSKEAQIRLVRSWQEESVSTGPRVVIATPEPMPTALRARFYPGEDRDALAPTTQEAGRIMDEIFPS